MTAKAIDVGPSNLAENGSDLTVTKQLGVSVIGTGIMGRTHAAVLESYHRSRVTGWLARSDRHREEAAAVSKAPVRRDLAETLADPATDAVLIATPDHAHREFAVAAAEAGKHVLIEKPLATSVEDARAIQDAVTANGVVGMTLFNHRFVPSYWQAKQLITERELGPLRVGYARKNDVRFVPLEMIAWAAQTTPAWFLSSHDIDLLLWYAQDRVERVFATAVSGTLQRLGVDTPDAIQAQLVLRGGGVLTVEACWSYPDSFPTMTDSFMEVVLAEGVIHLDRKSEQVEIADASAFSYPRNLLVNRVGGKPSGSTAVAVQHFVDCVLDEKEPSISLASSVHVTEVLAAIHESCNSGNPIEMKEK